MFVVHHAYFFVMLCIIIDFNILNDILGETGQVTKTVSEISEKVTGMMI